MTIQNKKTNERYRVTPEDWAFMKQKKLETGGQGLTYASLYRIIDEDDSSPLDESESSQENVPEVLKTFSGSDNKSSGRTTRTKITGDTSTEKETQPEE